MDTPFCKEIQQEERVKGLIKQKKWNQTGTMGSGKKAARLRSKRRQGVGKGRRSERRAAQKRNLMQVDLSLVGDNEFSNSRNSRNNHVNMGYDGAVIGELSRVEGGGFQNVYDILERQTKGMSRRSEHKGMGGGVLVPASQDSLSFLRCQSTSKKVTQQGSNKRIKSRDSHHLGEYAYNMIWGFLNLLTAFFGF